MSQRIVGSNFDTMSRETTSQPAASKALPTDLVPQKSSRSLGIFKEQDYRRCDDQENSRVHRTGFFSPRDKKPNFAIKFALGLDVQTNAKVGKFMSIEDSRQGALVCTDVEVLRQLPGRRGQEGGRVLCEWTEEVEQGVIDNMIVFQKPFPGAARTELESQLQRAVKVSAKGKHVKCKMDLALPLLPAGNRVPRPAEFARRKGRALVEARHVWLMARQWGVLFECATSCWSLWRRRAARSRPPAARSSWPPTYRWRSVRWQDSRSRRTRLWRVSPWQLA